MQEQELPLSPEIRPLTYGERTVRLGFNPSGNQAVIDVKGAVAALIDIMNEQREVSTDPEQKRLCSIAITELQGGCMWAVAALTY